ncbi:MAG: hypothetical protein WC054_03125 [Candidatus Nanopelagicales bacterium]
MNLSTERGHKVGTAAKVGAAVMAGAALMAIPAIAAANAVQTPDAEVSPDIRNAVTQASVGTNDSASVVAGPIGAGGGALEPRTPVVPVAPPVVPGAPVPAKVAREAGEEADLPAPTSAQIVSQKELLALVKKTFPADQVGNAMAVAQCESGQRSIVGSTNSNGTTDWGVFQLNDGGTLQGSLRRVGVSFGSTRAAQVAALDPVTNVKAAGAIYRDRGWAPWVCAYKQQIVASLYSNEKGPMYGRYNAVGGSMGSLEPSASDLAKPKDNDKAKQKAKEKEKAKEKAKEKEKAPTPSPKPSSPAPTTPSPAATEPATGSQTEP